MRIKATMILRYLLLLLVFFYKTRVGEALFVPEEVPSLVSFIYNNIPPIAKGHDSRIGLGFRVGPNADFQMVFELGPQKETQPLVKVTGFTDDSEETRKRHIPKSLQYYAPAPPAQSTDHEPMHVKHSGTPKGWLSAWKTAVSGKGLNSLRRSEKKWELETNELRYPSYLPRGYYSKSYHQHQPLSASLQRYNGYPGKMNHATINHLRQLYKEQPMK